ncbi:helix-turn-helix transcriptional regulator [Amycolatopsis sp. NPDC051758]|uniref:helix-turn-helix transcriptional regulator n=1 Tax=Amycolatopsis sp. NPDC051758 TaxID=3363935 RepID=UPI0037BA8ADE
MPPVRPQLGAFLRARRDRITPAQAGITPFPGPRRVPGLRRDELAVLAGVSAEYYGRLEQGRQRNVSRAVLEALARALRLTSVERAHLFDLAHPIARRDTPVTEAPQRPEPGLLRVMSALDHLPVLLLGNRGEVLARNALLDAVLGRPIELGTSFFSFLIQDPLARERIVNWTDFASTAIAAMRREAARRPFDQRLIALVDELRAADPQVARWWDDHTVRDYASVPKRIDHPQAGQLAFDIEIISAADQPDQRLVVYTAEPDSPTARLLPLIASWDVHPANR